MTITNIEIRNFKGIENIDMELPLHLSLSGLNGAGKTSFIEAVRYMLSGEEPDGSMVRIGADHMELFMTVLSESGEKHTFEKIVPASGSAKYRIDGSLTTKGGYLSYMAGLMGADEESVKPAVSQDILASMKPKELAKLLLRYIPEKKTVDDIISYISEATENMKTTMQMMLPEEVTLDALDEFLNEEKEERKSLKKELQTVSAVLSRSEVKKPEHTKEELLEKEKQLAKKQSDYAVYLEKLRQYEDYTKKRNAAIEQYKAKRDEFNKNTASKPDMEEKDSIEKDIRSVEEQIRSLGRSESAAEATLKSTEATMKALKLSRCPLSPELTCSTDKSGLMAKLQKSAEDLTVSIQSFKKESESALQRKKEFEDKLKAWNENLMQYQKKTVLYNDMQNIIENYKDKGEEPAKMEKPDIENELNTVRAELRAVDDYRNYTELLKKQASLTEAVSDAEALVKAFDDKGIVRQNVISSYTEFFTEEINAIADDEHEFQFRAEDGMRLYMKRDGALVPYESLSGGEKAYETAVLLLMLSDLTGTDIIFLDETSVLDDEVFGSLAELLSKCTDRQVIVNTLPVKERIEALENAGFRVENL